MEQLAEIEQKYQKEDFLLSLDNLIFNIKKLEAKLFILSLEVRFPRNYRK